MCVEASGNKLVKVCVVMQRSDVSFIGSVVVGNYFLILLLLLVSFAAAGRFLFIEQQTHALSGSILTG